MQRVPFDQLRDTLERALAASGLPLGRAALAARLIAESSLDGVPSHGLNLVPRLITMIRSGVVDTSARAEAVASHGALERWDGHRGVGVLNAYEAMQSAIALSRAHGIGCVALGNTNHWFRGGTYGWQAADAGVIGICWTNTLPNLPPWGADEPRIGNNPLVIAVPRDDGHVVLDMAMSQFSYGALRSYRTRGELLPVDGGFDREGHLTRDPAEILASMRPLPIGYWKGSGLSMLLDMVAAALSGGSATHQIPREPEREIGLSQVFIAIAPTTVGARDEAMRIVDAIVASTGVRYPGQRAAEARRLNLVEGVPVDPDAWRFVLRLVHPESVEE